MRTSRPLKHAPRPLLAPSGPSSAKSSKPGSKRRREEAEESTASRENAYSYDDTRSKGRTARRFQSARSDAVQDEVASRKSKGKGKARENSENDSEGGDDEGSNDFKSIQDIRGIKFKMGMDSGDEAGAFDEDDDEEIDSDLADTDHDEPAPSTSKQKLKNGKRKVATDFYDDEAEINLDEDSEDDEEEYMDLSEVLKQNAPPSRKAGSSTGPAARSEEAHLKSFGPSTSLINEEDSEAEQSEEDENEESDSEESDSDEDMSDAESDDIAALERLQGIISTLPASTKRSGEDIGTEDAEDGQARKRRKPLRKERTEVIPESDFAATSNKDGKLTLDTMLAAFSGPQAAALRKTLKPLAGSAATDNEVSLAGEVSRLMHDEATHLERERSKKARNKSTSALKQAGPLPAPLAPLHQAKIERQAAKEKQAEEVKKWEDTVKYMRGINKEGADDPEHRLILPLLDAAPKQGSSAAEMVSKFKPINSLEKQVSSMLNSTGMTQSSLLATENSALMDALPPASDKSAAHDAARVAQLRLARELMFRAERRAKRVAKIKSKTFRKIAKKARRREAEAAGDGSLTIDEMMELDALDGGSRAEAEREKLETMRAKERATLRHASGNSAAVAGGRWSRGLKGLDGMDDSIKDAIRQRESKQELLRRKVLGVEDDAGSDDSDHSGGEDDDNQDLSKIRESAFDELASLKEREEKEKSTTLPKGLMNMKFMQRAANRQQEKVDGLIDDFKMQVEDETNEDAGDDDNKPVPKAGKGGDLVHNNPGRMVFGPSETPKDQHAQAAVDATEDTASGGKRQNRRSKRSGHHSKTDGTVSTGNIDGSASSATLHDYNPFAKPTDSSKVSAKANPWLASSGPSLHVSRKINKAVVGKDSKATDKSSARLKKEKGKSSEAIKKAQEDATVEIDLSATLGGHVNQDAAPTESKQPGGKSAVSLQDTRQSMDATSEDEEDAHALPESLKRQQGPQAFRQRDLVAQAFAGDNVVADFEEMKRQKIEADAPQEQDLTLPGWGSWGGKGVRKQKNAKRIVKKLPGIQASDRKDAKYKNLIISEKTDRKAAKYQTKDLPYPYTSRAQYEQKLAQPVGVEWSTRGSHKEVTTPRVITKPGTAIRPVSRVV